MGLTFPLDTDACLATEVAAAAVDRCSATTVPCPTLAVGVSGHHLDFAGTLSLSADTLLRDIKDVSASLQQHGCTRHPLVNGHGGNAALLQQAVREIGLRGPVRAATLNYWQLARDALTGVRRSEPGGMAHGGSSRPRSPCTCGQRSCGPSCWKLTFPRRGSPGSS
jgi:creatinine amidohydrolase